MRRPHHQTKSAPMKTYTIKWHETLDSTNSQALREAPALDNLSVIAAASQTAGRGQRGNRWSAAPGENLTFSIFLRFNTDSCSRPDSFPALTAGRQFAISAAATLAQCLFLERHGIMSSIKWPNDIYCGDRKISGMLVENSLAADHVRTSIVGIGLNVNQTVFPEDLPNPVSMSGLTGRKYDIRTLLDEFMRVFSECLDMLEGPWSILKETYERRLYRKGTECSFADISGRDATLPADALVSGTGSGGKIFRGTIEGISETGLLKVRTSSGTKEFGFKEIAYII